MKRLSKKNQSRRLILASSSPQRSEMLTKLGIPFTVVKPEVDETVPDRLPPEKTALHLARKKALTVAAKMPDALILGADTVVILGRRIYGKPEDADAARAFLRAFSGRSHKVVTALSLCDEAAKSLFEAVETTRVTFARLSDEVIDWYIGTGEWRGAAGGYRVQGQASRFIRYMMGLEGTVTGLPVYPLMGLLAQTGILREPQIGTRHYLSSRWRKDF